MSNNTAAISSEAVTRAQADGALSAALTSVAAQSSAGTANGSYRLVAVSATDGAAAEFSVQVSADSGASFASAGMRIQVFAGPPTTSRVVFDTSQFLIRSGASGYTPFAVASGQLISNAYVPQSKVTGLGSLATKNTVAAGTEVTGLGAFAYLAKLSPGNIATYMDYGVISSAYIGDASVTAAKIADANITNAKIADGSITNAKIAYANVDYLQIAGEAVSTISAYSASQDGTSCTFPIYFNMAHDGGFQIVVSVMAFGTVSYYNGTNSHVWIDGGNEIYGYGSLALGSRTVMTAGSRSAGTHAINVYGTGGDGLSGFSIFALILRTYR